MGHPNNLSAIAALCVPLAIAIGWAGWSVKNKKIKTLAVGVSCFLLIWSAILGGSVASFIAIILSVSMIAVVFLCRVLKKGRVLLIMNSLLLATVVSLIVIYVIYSNDSIRMSDVTISDNIARVQDTTGQGRAALLYEAGSLIADNPIFGYGMDQISRGQDPDKPITTDVIHNVIILSWVAGGILAFIGMILVYWRTLKLIVRATRAAIKGQRSLLDLGLASSAAGWLFLSMTNPIVYGRFAWLSIGLLCGLSQEFAFSSKRITNVRPSTVMNLKPVPFH
jgi:O-antigen ligase